jgi:hypothetical protein
LAVSRLLRLQYQNILMHIKDVSKNKQKNVTVDEPTHFDLAPAPSPAIRLLLQYRMKHD